MPSAGTVNIAATTERLDGDRATSRAHLLARPRHQHRCGLLIDWYRRQGQDRL